MEIKFAESALHDDYKFEVSLKIDDEWIDPETTKMAKLIQPMPDEDYVDHTIREHSEGNIIIDVWKINPEHRSSFSNTQSWVGQYFIAPKIWKEEITARLMQISTDLVKTIIAEIDIKLKKEIWKIVGEKKKKFEFIKKAGTEKEVHLQNEKVIGRCPAAKEAIEAIDKRVAAMNKKAEEEHMRTLEEIDLNTAFTSDEFTIEQNNDSGKIEIKMVFTGRSKKEFIRELTANEKHYVSEFAKFFIKDVVAQITWESKYIDGEEMYNSGSIEKTFLGDGKKDLIDEVFNYARAISDIEVYANDSNASEVLAKYNAWLEKMRGVYTETFYAKTYTFELDPTNDANYLSFKIKKGNSSDEVTIIMVADKDAKISPDKEDISFKDVLKEILINSVVNEYVASTRYKMDDLKNVCSLFNFLKEKTIEIFGDLNVTKIYDSEKLVAMANWISHLVNIAKEKAAKEKEVQEWPPKDCHIEAFFPFKARFFIEGVKIKFETKVDFRDWKPGRMALDEITKALTKKSMHWHIKLLEPGNRTEFDAVDAFRCDDFENFVQYFKRIMERAHIEFEETDNYRRTLLKIVDSFRTFTNEHTGKIEVKEKTAEEILKEEFRKSIEELEGCFERYNHFSDEYVRLAGLLGSGSLRKQCVLGRIKDTEKDLQETKNRFYGICRKLAWWVL